MNSFRTTWDWHSRFVVDIGARQPLVPSNQQVEASWTSLPLQSIQWSARTANVLSRTDLHTLGDLAEQSPATLLALKNFGRRCLKEVHHQLARLVEHPHCFEIQPLELEKSPAGARQPLVPSNQQVEASWTSLPLQSIQWSARTANVLSRTDLHTLGDLAEQSPATLLALKNFGRRCLKEVHHQLARLVEHPHCFEIQPLELEKSPAEVEKLIIDDLETFLLGQTDRAKNIYCMRYGIRQTPMTLEEIGQKVGVTRERVRQIQVKLQGQLPRAGKVPRQQLILYLQHRSGESFHEIFPQLDALFVDSPLTADQTSIKSIKNNRLIEFLEDYTGVERKTYQTLEHQIVGINAVMGTRTAAINLAEFFEEIPSPLSLELFKQELQSSYGLSETGLGHATDYLVENKKCRVTEKGVVPQNLSIHTAATHILLHFPNGCHWRTLWKILQHQKITSVKTLDPRGLVTRLSVTKTIYLYGRGIYRHLSYLRLGDFNIQAIVKATVHILKKSQRSFLGLKEIYTDILNQLKIQISFYDLRCILQQYGSPFGLYFYGKSGTHTLGLQNIEEIRTNSRIVLSTFETQNKALHFDELRLILSPYITDRTIHFLLGELYDANEIVRVNPSTYCLPDIAFSQVDQAVLIQDINAYVSRYDLIESDFLREHLNAKHGLYYSKFFYSSFVKFHAKANGWHHSVDLLSSKMIEYERATSAMRDFLKSRKTFKEDSEVLLEFYGISQLSLDRYKYTQMQDLSGISTKKIIERLNLYATI